MINFKLPADMCTQPRSRRSSTLKGQVSMEEVLHVHVYPVREGNKKSPQRSPDLHSMAAPPLPTSPRLAAILSAKVQGDGAEYTALLRQLSASEPAAGAMVSSIRGQPVK